MTDNVESGNLIDSIKSACNTIDGIAALVEGILSKDPKALDSDLALNLMKKYFGESSYKEVYQMIKDTYTGYIRAGDMNEHENI